MTDAWNCFIGFPNFVDANSAYATVSFSGGSWQTTLSLVNLRTPYMQEVARSTDAANASTQFVVDLGVVRQIFGVGIDGHTLTQLGRWRLTVAVDSGFTNVVLPTTAWIDAWPVSYAQGSFPMGHPAVLTGKPTLEEAAGEYPPLRYFSATPITGRYVKIEVDDTANPDGYVDLARLMICGGHQFSINMAYESGFDFETPTQVDYSLGGTLFTDDNLEDEAPIVRTIAVFSFNYLPDDEALIWIRDMAKRVGVSRQVLFAYDPTDTIHRTRRTFVATMRALPPLRAVSFGLSSSAFEIVQVL